MQHLDDGRRVEAAVNVLIRAVMSVDTLDDIPPKVLSTFARQKAINFFVAMVSHIGKEQMASFGIEAASKWIPARRRHRKEDCRQGSRSL
jgi:hypothetical protein